MKALKKIAKFLAWTLGIILVLAVILVLTIQWWSGPAVTSAANAFGPSIVKTELHLGDFGLNPYKGVFHTGDFQLLNPAGFREKYAVTLGEFRVELEPKTVTSEVIHIQLVRIKDVFISYCFNNSFQSNFTAIQEGMKDGAEVEDESAAEESEAKPQEEASSSQKKVIIDRLEIENVSAKIGMVRLPLVAQQVVFKDIGKDSGGKTFAEVYDSTIGPIVKVAESAVDNTKKLSKLTVSGLDSASESLKETGKNLKEVGKGLKNVGKDLKDLFK